MKILATSNHGNTFNPKEGADARKYNLLMELVKNNEVFVLESDRYQGDKNKVTSIIPITYFHDFFISKYPLSFILDFNLSYIAKMISLVKNKKFDIIQISFCYGIIVTKIITFFINKKTKVIYDAHNVEAEIIIKTSSPNFNPLIKWFFWIYVPLVERLAVKFADHIICVSENDRLSFIQKYAISSSKIDLIPSGTKIRPIIANNFNKDAIRRLFDINENKLVILFHGTYKYAPNKEAMDSIVNYIAPKVHEKFEHALFLLAGNGVPVFEKSNVKSVGFVENLDSLLYVSDIAIVPIINGGGTRLKVLDYMSVGLPIVSTEKGIEGIEFTAGKDAIVCGDVNTEFVEEIIYLLKNEKKRMEIGMNAYNLSKNIYDWQVIGKKLQEVYSKMIS